MENGTISDDQISASSQYTNNFPAFQGRLHIQKIGLKQGVWAAALPLDGNQWLQIDLRSQQTKVTRVATQGRNKHHQWVTKYKLQYGNKEESLQYFKEQRQSAVKVRLQIPN